MIILILLLFKITQASYAHDDFDSFCRQNLDRTGNSLRQIFDSVGFQKVNNMSLPNTISDFEYSFPTNTTNTNQMRSFGVISTPLERLNGGHEGVDISGKLGSDVYAVRGGEVVYVLNNCKNFKDKWCGNGWGNHIVIKHDNNFYSRYAHLDRVNVEKGDNVLSGTRIASLGSSGLSNGPHLHFEIGIKKDEFKDCLTPQNFDFVLDPKKLFR